MVLWTEKQLLPMEGGRRISNGHRAETQAGFLWAASFNTDLIPSLGLPSDPRSLVTHW